MTKRTRATAAELLSEFPAAIRAPLRALLDPPGFCGVIPAADAQRLSSELKQPIETLMFTLLPFAQCYARASISDFWVGEVGRGLTGNLYFGCNMEFTGEMLGFSVQGEQSTTVNAWVHGEEGLSAIALPAPPCGYCRQFLCELGTASQLRILVPERPPTTLADLLPDHFGPHEFGLEGRLMKKENHNLMLREISTDPVVLAALSAANMSYAPYTHSYSGVAVSASNGRIYRGPYAESAAFNPSMSPIQAALSCFNLGGERFDAIRKVVLVEIPDAKVSQVTATRAVLKSISKARLSVVHAVPAR